MEIDQFCLQARSLKNAACVSLIQRAIGHKKIFLFGELLDEPNIQALRSTEFAKSLETLELFAYGTYGNYLANPQSYLELTQAQIDKLKKLTIVSMAEENALLPYEKLMDVLQISDLRSLEDLIIEAIYDGILKGKLDQKAYLFRVFDFLGRDVREQDLDHIVHTLQGLHAAAVDLQGCLQDSSSIICEQRANDNQEWEHLQARLVATKALLKESIESGDIGAFRDREFTDAYVGRSIRQRVRAGVPSIGIRNSLTDVRSNSPR